MANGQTGQGDVQQITMEKDPCQLGGSRLALRLHATIPGMKLKCSLCKRRKLTASSGMESTRSVLFLFFVLFDVLFDALFCRCVKYLCVHVNTAVNSAEARAPHISLLVLSALSFSFGYIYLTCTSVLPGYMYAHQVSGTENQTQVLHKSGKGS